MNGTSKRILWILIPLLLAATDVAFAMAPQGEQSANPFSFLIMIGLFFAIFYFIVIRPQQKEQKAHQARIAALKKNDRIVTSGGIHGTVRATKDKTLVVEIAEGVKITLNRNAVAGVLTPEGTGKPSDADDGNEESE